MNSIPDDMKSGKMELSDDMLDVVAGGSIYDSIRDAVDAFGEWFNDFVGEEIYMEGLNHQKY